MNKTSIEFCDFTWNPIVGCCNGCEYCWAEKLNNRYHPDNDFSVPKFYEERLSEKVPRMPKNRNYIASAISPHKPIVFVVDMGDIFSKGVDIIWIERVFEYIKTHQEVNFLLLTKRPFSYFAWYDLITENTFIGTSLDYAHNYKRTEAIRDIGRQTGIRTFVNIEPLMSRMDAVDFSGIDFIFVGALTGQRYVPQRCWHESIRHDKIYYKRNYINYFPELNTIYEKV